MDTALTSCGRPATVHIQLPPDAQAAGRARRTAARVLSLEPGLCPDPVTEDLVLIVSELVTNAVTPSASGKQVIAVLTWKPAHSA
ncbi:hypothetical protein ACFXHD_00875 [Streptomyces hydrogenans]|uniref:hypothetical protein n=1 Tax=Streptomyces hydrogenans TaxID=1873719 RepID=UPI0035D63894